MSLFSLLDLICTILAAGLWYIRPELGPWPLVLVLIGQGARILTTPVTVRRTVFDLPLLLFLLSAAVGVWVAYDRTLAWAKFWWIVGGLALYNSLVYATRRVRVGGRGEFSPLCLLWGTFSTIVAVYFLLTNDWILLMGKLPWLDPIMRWLAAWQPDLPGHRMAPNVAGGIIAAFLPLQVVALRRGRARIGVPLVGLSAFGLLMSSSRGAWLALAIVAGGWGLWRLSGWLTPRLIHLPAGSNAVDRSVQARRRTQIGIWVTTLAVLGLAGLLALLLTPWGVQLSAAASNRLVLQRNSLDLVSDYLFTGMGPGKGAFQIVYSSYVLLIHVNYTFFSHNLFLDVWLEQGLLGLLAFGWLIVTAVQPHPAISRWRPVALATLGVILLHGLGDDTLYGSRGVLLLFVPFALVARPGETPVIALERHPIPRLPPIYWRVAAVLALAVLLLPSSRAAFQANLGAVAQTQAELSVYHWPEWPIQDAVRRSPEVNLAPAIAHYQTALALNPSNATANRRLGQIELSLGQYDEARRHLEAAYAAAPNQRATRQLLGESYAIEGEIERAAALWRTVDVSLGQLALRQQWYKRIGEPQRADWVAQAAARSGEEL